MKAIVLIGGLGTRLYPLTYATPKSLLPIVNVPFLRRLLDWFKYHNITEVVLALSNLASPILDFLNNLPQDPKLSVICRIEATPLGSGGALKNCAGLIEDTFVLFNGDILTDLNLSDLIVFHKAKRAMVTATFNEVDDPTQYGIAHMDANDRVLGWQEKPAKKDAKSMWGNVGAWVMEPEVLDYIPEAQVVSIEKDTFPILLQQGRPFMGYKFYGYWKDIGTIDKYLQADRDLLYGLAKNKAIPGAVVSEGIWIGESTTIERGAQILPPVAIGSHCSISAGASIEGPITIGDDCVIGENTRILSSMIWPFSRIGSGTTISGSIVASAEIGSECVIRDACVISPGSIVHSKSVLESQTILGPRSILRPVRDMGVPQL